MRTLIALLRDKSCFFGIRDYFWAVVAKASDLYDRHTGTARFSQVDVSR